MHALQTVVLAARAAGVPAFDGVYNRLDDEEDLAAECREGRSFGYDGKSLIHPSQIETANRIFGPSEEDVAAAERLIAAATGGAERFEGRMIEDMHVRSEEHTTELQSLMRTSSAVFCLKKKKTKNNDKNSKRNNSTAQRD